MTAMEPATAPVNGHARPVTLQPLQLPVVSGPVSPLQQDDPGQSRTEVGKPGRRRDVDGDTVIRVLAAIVVLAVAAFAAIVSYSHIFELGRHHGQDGTAARLLPLSVDGLIAAASLVMLHAARRKLPVPSLSRWMLGLGVAATVAANVEYGMPFGWLSAVVSAWPAVAFVGSVEMAVRFVRDARQDMSGDGPGAAGQPGKNGGEGTGLAGSRDSSVAAVAAPPVTPRRVGDKGGDSGGDRPPRGRVLTKQERAVVIRDNPGLTNAALAALAGCKPRTIQRDKSDTAKPEDAGSAT